MPFTIACYRIRINHGEFTGNKETDLNLVIEGEQPLNRFERKIEFDGAVVRLELIEEQAGRTNLQLKHNAYLYIHTPPPERREEHRLINRIYPGVDWSRWW